MAMAWKRTSRPAVRPSVSRSAPQRSGFGRHKPSRTRVTQQRAMPVLEQQQERLRRRPGPSALRRRCRSLTIAGHILELELLA
jgi:hypothetical protein